MTTTGNQPELYDSVRPGGSCRQWLHVEVLRHVAGFVIALRPLRMAPGIMRFLRHARGNQSTQFFAAQRDALDATPLRPGDQQGWRFARLIDSYDTPHAVAMGITQPRAQQGMNTVYAILHSIRPPAVIYESTPVGSLFCDKFSSLFNRRGLIKHSHFHSMAKGDIRTMYDGTVRNKKEVPADTSNAMNKR